jgi:2,4-dienoyl-CoA reductase-like NADH-dependent reductase (Old Yellow Enzyme family)
MKILSSPIQIGNRQAPNRIVNQPMECNDADEKGCPSELTFDRYRRLAEGGAGIIIIEALTISQESRARKNQLGIYPETAKALEKMIREMRTVNPEPLILMQITHSGRQSGAGFSRVVSAFPSGDPKIHVLTEKEIEEIEDGFVQAASIAEGVGADGIDFKQCHGYFCSEILRPANTRPDRFGGSFENRSRFLRETVGKIKKTIRSKSFILGARFSIYEGIPGGFGTSGPGEVIEDLTEPMEFARLMENLGFHYINVTAGIPTITPEIVRPTKAYPEGVYRHFGWAKVIKQVVHIPVIGSGYTYLGDGKNNLKEPDPAKKSFQYWAERNLEKGLCDLVGIGRQSFADPLFAKKILAGKNSEIHYCIACGGCSILLRSQAQTGCAAYSDFYKGLLKEVQKAAK